MTVNPATPGPQENDTEKNPAQDNLSQGSSTKRNRFRKPLMFLILFTAALGALWLSMQLPSKDLQEIAHIENLGGKVGRPFLIYNDLVRFIPRSLWKNIPRGQPEAVFFFGPQPMDDDLIRSFNHFLDLQQIKLSGTLVTDRILEVLAKQRKLQFLWLNSTRVTDEGVAHLKGNQTLEGLYLDGTQITDQGIEQLSELRLISLSVANTEITDASVEFLLKMRKLRSLNIEGTKISPEGIARLKQKERLTLDPGLSKH